MVFIVDYMRKSLPKKHMLLIDLCCILISFLLTTWILYGDITKEWFYNLFGISFSIIILAYTAIYCLYDTYSKLFKRGFLEELITVVKINGWLAITLISIMFIFQEGASYSRLFLLCFFLLNILITYIVRQYYKVLLLTVYKKSGFSNKIMILTTSDQVHKVLKNIRSENEWEYQITYLTVLDKNMVGQTVDGVEVKADFIDMFEIAKREAIDGVFIHIPCDYPYHLDLDELILEFEDMGMTVNLSINTFGLKLHEKVIQEVSSYHVLTFSSRIFDESQMQLKRVADVIGGLIGCILTLVLTVFIAPAILIESPGPIFFSQIRVGRNGRRFKIYKFRSMYTDAEERKLELMKQNEMNGLMFKMKNDPRITRVGRFLRNTSLDEFPQFFNILKGDMSLVGTRPPTEDEFLQYEGRHKRRLALKSGLTGLWQVSGRSNIKNFEDVVKMDLEYIDNWSIWMDFKILLKTVGVVLFGKGSR